MCIHPERKPVGRMRVGSVVMRDGIPPMGRLAPHAMTSGNPTWTPLSTIWMRRLSRHCKPAAINLHQGDWITNHMREDI